MKRTYLFILALIAILLYFKEIPVQKRLPEFQSLNSYYTTLYFPSNWESNPRFIKIRAWFETYPELVEIKNRTKFNVYTEGTEVFEQNYRGKVTVPSILILKSSGQVVFAATGNNIPKNPEKLISKIKEKVQLKANCNDPNCPKCNPKPKKPISRPAPIKNKKEEPYVFYVIALLAGIGANLYNKTSEGKNA